MTESAFPFTGAGTEGMTLRDYFAAKAMPQAIKEIEESESFNINEMAMIAYQYADAMMKARNG